MSRNHSKIPHLSQIRINIHKKTSAASSKKNLSLACGRCEPNKAKAWRQDSAGAFTSLGLSWSRPSRPGLQKANGRGTRDLSGSFQILSFLVLVCISSLFNDLYHFFFLNSLFVQYIFLPERRPKAMSDEIFPCSKMAPIVYFSYCWHSVWPTPQWVNLVNLLWEKQTPWSCRCPTFITLQNSKQIPWL